MESGSDSDEEVPTKRKIIPNRRYQNDEENEGDGELRNSHY